MKIVTTPNTSRGTSNQDSRPRLGPFNGAYRLSPLPPTNGDPGNRNNKSWLGPFTRAYLISSPPTQSISFISSPPTQSTSLRTLVLQTLNCTNLDLTQTTKPDNLWTELSPLSPSIESPSYTSGGSDTGAIPSYTSDCD